MDGAVRRDCWRDFVRRIHLDKAPVGAVVARTIHSLEGVLLLSEGTKLTDSIRSRLLQNGVREIYVEDDFSQGLIPSQTVQDAVLTQIKTQVREIMSIPSLKSGLNARRVTELVERLLEQILASGDILHHLSDIRTIDDYTFSHCVNVAVYSLVTGVGLGMRQDMLRELGMGAILHDVGKLLIRPEVLQKPTSLNDSEFEEVKRHVALGHELVSSIKGITPAAASISLNHHERMDGSGYPRGLKGDEIPLTARIVAIADVYDALTSDRVYREREEPHKAMDYITEKIGTHFDPAVADVFVRHLAHYPVGTAVILNTGEKGLVARQNLKFPHRPVVRVVIDQEGRLLKTHYESDLSVQPENRIASIWEI